MERQRFGALPEPSTLLVEWLWLVDQHQVVGVNVHDCRLAAFMKAHGLADLLTFNTKTG